MHRQLPLRKRNARREGAHKVFAELFKLRVVQPAGDTQLNRNMTIDLGHAF